MRSVYHILRLRNLTDDAEDAGAFKGDVCHGVQAFVSRRLGMLEWIVLQDAETRTWIGDLTRESLGGLGLWFKRHVVVRSKTENERQELFNAAPNWVAEYEEAVPELTDVSQSYCADVGLYCAECLRSAHADLQWEIDKDNESAANYGQLVISGFRGGLTFSPVRVGMVIGMGMARGTKGPEELTRVYDVWHSMVM